MYTHTDTHLPTYTHKGMEMELSYLGSHNAESHAIVLLQGHRDNFRLLPHWLETRETDSSEGDERERGNSSASVVVVVVVACSDRRENCDCRR